MASTLLKFGASWLMSKMTLTGARSLYVESLRHSIESDDKMEIVWDLIGLAGVAARRGGDMSTAGWRSWRARRTRCAELLA